MSDDAAKDLEIALKLVLGKQMKEALLAGDTEKATKLAAELQEAEDLVEADPSQKATHASAAQKRVRPSSKSKDAGGRWIN